MGRGDHVMVNDGNRFFRVHRASPGDLYALGEITENGDAIRTPRPTPRLLREAPNCPWSYSEFPSYVSSQDFKIKEITRTSDAARPEFKLVFSYQPADASKLRMEGWLQLDPGARYVLTAYDIQVITRPPGRGDVVVQQSGTTRYTSQNGVPVPAHASYRREERSKLGTGIEEAEFELDRFTLETTPDEEFTLAAFGLGDFESPPTTPHSRFGYYALAVAVALAAVSVVLWRLAKRTRRGQAGAA